MLGVELADGRSVVIKHRPWSDRLVACLAVQRHLWLAGFPCPEPLAGPTFVDGFALTAEAFVPRGTQLEASGARADLFAEAFADLIGRVPRPASLPGLDPPPPWVWWTHDRPGIWAPADDRNVDLNAHAGPWWLDRIGASARQCLVGLRGREVVGHADWESQNLRWIGRRLHVVHDWDSVACLPEATLAGAAAGVFTATGEPLTEPGIDEIEAFMAAYERAGRLRWKAAERAAAWAACTWVRAFNAKKASLDREGEAVVERLRREAPELERRFAT